jgi:hypothetical protein
MIYTDDHNIQFKLNTLKHHALYLRSRLEHWRKLSWSAVKEELLKLGNNQFDVYTGELTVDEIGRQVNQILLQHNLKKRSDLQKWLGKQGYRTVQLSDQSKWVIRESESEDIPVHLHPARNQDCVKRIRAVHLKTAVALIHEKKRITSALLDCTTEKMNTLRIDRLELSPVRSVEDCHKILETVTFLENL